MAPGNDANLYQYSNIAKPDSIRLLELLPSTDELVRCNVVKVKMSQEPAFEALSYTWGKNEFPHELAEVSTHSSFYITDNLRSALYALSPDTGSRLLWVDAVCINQSDNVEKGWQVGMMKDIYQHASRVIVWLGPEPSNRVDAERNIAGFEELERIGRNIFPPFPRQIASLEALEQLKKLAKDCNGLDVLYLYRREWYERVWTVQEFILANDLIIQSGNRWITYDLFSKATAALWLLARNKGLMQEWWTNEKGLVLLFIEPNSSRAWRLIQQRERYSGLRQMQHFDDGEIRIQSETSKPTSVYAYEDPLLRPSSIIEYCAFAKNLDCSNERDRLYGMLGIAYDALDIEADYNLMPEKLWETLAVKTLLLNDLTVLHYANQSAGGASRVRSFAADFGHPMVDLVRLGGHGYPRYHAATQIAPKVELEEDGSVRIHAIKVDTVNQVNFIRRNQDSAESGFPPAKLDALALPANPDFILVDQDIIHQLYEWWKFWLAAKGPRYYDATDGKWAFPRTLIADNALPTTKEAFGHWTLKKMDLLFAMFLLAKPHVDSSGQTTTLIDTWRVYELLGRTVRVEVRLFPDDEDCTTYYFPSSGAGPAQDEQLLVFLKMYDRPLYHRPDFSDTYAKMQEELSFDTSEQTQVVEITSPLKEHLDLYATAISSILSQRHLFFTNVRLLGLGPRCMKAGDVVIVPEGSQTPFVYRREIDAENSLEGGCVRRGQLIGECYVHGLMDGDPVRKLASDYEESHLELILT